MTHLTQAEFARRRGVNKSTVTRWIQSGRMTTEPNGLIDPERAAAQLDATESPLPHHQARKAQFDETRQEVGHGAHEKIAQEAPQLPATGSATSAEASTRTNAKGQPLSELELLQMRKAEAVTRNEEHKAELSAIEIDLKAGALVERAEVELVFSDFGATLRGLIETLPTRLHAVHQGDAHKVAEIEGVATDLLHEMADHMKRKMEEIV